jgi:hypothetical protein
MVRAVAREVTASGLTTNHLHRVHALSQIGFAGEEDEKELHERLAALCLAQPDDTPSSFVTFCGQLAELMDEVAARWEKEFQS